MNEVLPLAVDPTPAQAKSHSPPAREEHADSWISGLQSLCSTVVIAIFVITFLVQAFQIPSESMENTLLTGDYLLVDKVEYSAPGWWRALLPYDQVRRGDIIVFRYPVHPEQHFVKRVIGRPGDRVRIRDSIVYVNGRSHAEDYALLKPLGFDGFRDNFPTTRYTSSKVTADWSEEFPQLTRNGELIVPQGHYFVLGDNRNESLDSRYWGFVSQENIVGKPMLIYLSFEPHRSWGTSPGGRIGAFAARVVSLPASIRWDRTFRFVR
jgi:signal peptidase I